MCKHTGHGTTWFVGVRAVAVTDREKEDEKEQEECVQ